MFLLFLTVIDVNHIKYVNVYVLTAVLEMQIMIPYLTVMLVIAAI